MSSESNKFINRANKTIIEGKLDILFNLLLVRKGARLAYLLEVANFPMINSTILIDTIKRIYPEFTYTTEYKIGDIIHRMFIHIKLLVPKGDMKHDVWVARNLEFNCLGIPDESNIRYSLKYTINNINFYTEICPTQESIVSKILLFEPVANDLGWTLKEIINRILPRDIWFKALLYNHEWLLENADEFIDFLLGFGLSYIKLIIGNRTSKDGIQYLLQNQYKLLLLTTLRSQKDPFGFFWPVTIDISKIFEEIENEQFMIEKDPIVAFENVECIFRNKYPEIWTDDRRTKFRISKNELFYSYELHKKQIGGFGGINKHSKIYYQ